MYHIMSGGAVPSAVQFQFAALHKQPAHPGAAAKPTPPAQPTAAEAAAIAAGHPPELAALLASWKPARGPRRLRRPRFGCRRLLTVPPG